MACEGPGLIQQMLNASEIPYELHEYYLTEGNFDMTNYSAMIILGGPMSVNDEISLIQKELQVILEAIRLNLPVLGICLGSQLISKSLGGEITQNPVKEIGIAEIILTSTGKKCYLFQGLPHRFKVFQWHGETFSIPEDAQLLATSPICRHQAFQRDMSWGLQFHFEMTPEIVSKLVLEYADELIAEGLEADQILRDFKENYPLIKEMGERIFTRFLNFI